MPQLVALVFAQAVGRRKWRAGRPPQRGAEATLAGGPRGWAEQALHRPATRPRGGSIPAPKRAAGQAGLALGARGRPGGDRGRRRTSPRSLSSVSRAHPRWPMVATSADDGPRRPGLQVRARHRLGRGQPGRPRRQGRRHPGRGAGAVVRPAPRPAWPCPERPRGRRRKGRPRPRPAAAYRPARASASRSRS